MGGLRKALIGGKVGGGVVGEVARSGCCKRFSILLRLFLHGVGGVLILGIDGWCLR